MIKKVIKRNGERVEYNKKKIIIAISNANTEVESDEKISRAGIDKIIKEIEATAPEEVTVEQLQDMVEDGIMGQKKYKLAKKYILYREKHSIIRQTNTTDKSILELISYKNKEVNSENANKNPVLLSTQRDYIAGETSKDLTDRILLPEKIVKAHKDGVLHFHDKDYFIQKGMFNCCLVNIKDMLDNGTVMNGKLIESPKSFQVACTVMTQIIAAVASNQYGGQSINIKHLGKYLRRTYEKEYNKAVKYWGKEYYLEKYDEFKKEYTEKYPNYDATVINFIVKDMLRKITSDIAKKVAEDAMRKDLKAGVQTIQYQINTLMTTNGQSPFVTLFLHMDDKDEYSYEISLIIEEILKQRLEGIKNDAGIYITPAFPKLIYVLGENNCLEGGKYDYLTELAAKCSSKRMYPDYISEKIMRQNYEDNVFSPMGCRSFLSAWKDEDGNYKWEGRFNQGVVSINLPQIGIIANGDEDLFWKLFDERLELCKEALDCRHESLLGTISDVSPIHWQHGAIARLKPGEKIDKYLKNGYSTISLGYIGLYELTKVMTGEAHTTEKGSEFALKVMHHLRDTVDKWKKESPDGLAYGLYGTPAESLCYRFAKIDKEKFGDIPDVTDKGYYTNSYHVDVREKIDAFSKLKFESQFQPISSGGAISYIEVPYLYNNLDAIKELIKFMYNNIQYAEFNTKSDYCTICGYQGEISLNKKLQWECPCCGVKMTSDGFPLDPAHPKNVIRIVRRTCGYLGENLFNEGKSKEISKRVTHI